MTAAGFSAWRWDSPPSDVRATACALTRCRSSANTLAMKSFEAGYDDGLATVAEMLTAEGMDEAPSLLRTAECRIAETGYDNWNGGATIWTIYLTVPPAMFARLSANRQAIEAQINERLKSVLEQFTHDWCSHAPLDAAAHHNSDTLRRRCSRRRQLRRRMSGARPCRGAHPRSTAHAIGRSVETADAVSAPLIQRSVIPTPPLRNMPGPSQPHQRFSAHVSS